MVHDSQLFTLTLLRRRHDVRMMDLVPMQPSYSTKDQTVAPSYSFSRAVTLGPLYDVQLVDSLLMLPLASVQSPSTLERTKEIRLMNPDAVVVLEKQKMTFKQEWKFKWEQNEFACRRDGKEYEIVAIRKPDPEIEIARYHSRTKARPAFFQVFDYNVQRIEVGDKRGLEILAVMAFLVSLDVEYDEKHKDRESGNIYMGAPIMPSSDGVNNEDGYWSGPYKAERLGQTSGTGANPAALAGASSVGSPKQGADAAPQRQPQQHAQTTHTEPSQAYRPEANEIVVDLHTPVEVLAQHAVNLLRVDVGGQGCYMIILRALTPQTSFVAVRVAAEVKSKWSKLAPTAKGRTLDPQPGSSEVAEDLYQYVRDPSIDGQKSTPAAPATPPQASQRPKIIKLNAPEPAANPSDYASSSSSATAAEPYSAPKELAIFLSKEKIDEFEASQRRPAQAFSSTSTFSPPPKVASPPGGLPGKPPKHPQPGAASHLSPASDYSRPGSSHQKSSSSQHLAAHAQSHNPHSQASEGGDAQPSMGRKLMGRLKHIGSKIPSE